MSSLLNAWAATQSPATTTNTPPAGKRPSHLPKDNERIVWSLILTTAQRDKVRRMGGAKVVRAMIDAA